MNSYGAGGLIALIIIWLFVLIARAISKAKGTPVPVNNRVDSREFDDADQLHGDASLLGRQP